MKNNNIFIETLFMSKLIGLNVYLFICKNNNKFVNNICLNIHENVYYVIKIRSNNENFFLIASLNEINFNELYVSLGINEYDLIEKHYDYKNVFCNLSNIEEKILIKENLLIFWKNQFLVSSILDYYNKGLISDLPNEWESYNKNIKEEQEINKKIFLKVNDWLKQKNITNLKKLNQEKIKEIIC